MSCATPESSPLIDQYDPDPNTDAIKWYAMPIATPQPEETTDTVYARQATAYLEDLDEDCVIVRLLCHG